MTDKVFLENYRSVVLELRQLHDQLQRCRLDGKPQGAKAQRYDSAGRGTNDPTSAAVQLFDGLQERISAANEQLATMAGRYNGILRSCGDGWTMVILAHYYGMGETDAEIGLWLGFDRSAVGKRRRKAVTGCHSSPSAPPADACLPAQNMV